MTNPFWLTLAAILMTFRGDVPLETWFPLFEDILRNLIPPLFDFKNNLCYPHLKGGDKMEIELTKDSQKVLVLLYKEYLTKVKSGCSKSQSREFNGDNLNFITGIHPDDVYESLIELKANKLIKMDITGDFELTDIAVINMENRFKNNLKDVLSFVSQFI